MNVFGRNIKIKLLLNSIVSTLDLLFFSVQMKKPVSVFAAYLNRASPLNNKVTFKNGKQIHFSSNPHDIITFMVLFGRKEYGEINKEAIIIDIGANIGVFAMYAVFNGARKVYSYEPCGEAFETIKKNIEANQLDGVVEVNKLAVYSKSNQVVSINRISSPYNEVTLSNAVAEEFEEVKTINLKDILKGIEKPIDLLKMDCEGYELDILRAIDKKSLNRINEIRLEHHSKYYDKSDLFDLLREKGYKLIHEKFEIAWFILDSNVK